jgi:hypothetical protein
MTNTTVHNILRIHHIREVNVCYVAEQLLKQINKSADFHNRASPLVSSEKIIKPLTLMRIDDLIESNLLLSQKCT